MVTIKKTALKNLVVDTVNNLTCYRNGQKWKEIMNIIVVRIVKSLGRIHLDIPVIGINEKNPFHSTYNQKKLLNSRLRCKVMSWNVSSIINEEKLNYIIQIFEDNDILVACVCETWFDSKCSLLILNNLGLCFEVIHVHREDKHGGGKAIIYKCTSDAKQG